MAEVKRVRGAPTKKEALNNKQKRANKKLAEDIINGNVLISDNYLKYIELMNAVALNDTALVAGVGITQQVSTLKYLVELCQKQYKEELDKESEKESEMDADGGNRPEKTNKPLIQLFCSNAE